MNITLKQLRYFEALAHHGHFGRAALALSLSQPALSLQIMELEREIGTTLFERASRKIRLTGFGEEFAVRVRTILQSLDDLGALARAAGEGLSGQLRLGIIPTIAPYILPRLIGRIERIYPELNLHVRETVTSKLIDELIGGRLDAAVIALPSSEVGLKSVALFDEDFVLVRHSSQANEPVPNANQLAKMKLLLLEEGHCFRDQALAFCGTRSSLGREALDGSSLSTLVQMVGAGMGVTLVPQMAVGVETRAANVVVNQFANPRPTRTIGMVWRKTNPLAGQLQSIAEAVSAAAMDHVSV